MLLKCYNLSVKIGLQHNKTMFPRLYHTSCVTYSFKKQGVKLAKLLNPGKKRQWYPADISEPMPSIKSLTKVKYEPGKRGIRRCAMLNKLFMKNITDLMSTGTVSMDLVGRGIEVSKVNVSSDMQTLSVYWVCKGNTSDADTETLLNKTAGALRHELSTLRLMGEVPYIVFVKDNQESRVVELDRRLMMADYGEDYVPTDLGHLLKSEFTLNTKLSPEMKAKIKQLEEDLPLTDEPIPEMTHNVYGLDHAKIMNRLLAARKKSRDAWVNLDSHPAPVISYKATDEPSDIDAGKQKKELYDFLLQRKILHEKLRRQERRGRDDWIRAADGKDEDTDPEVPCDEEDDDDYAYDAEENYCYGETMRFQPTRDEPKV